MIFTQKQLHLFFAVGIWVFFAFLVNGYTVLTQMIDGYQKHHHVDQENLVDNWHIAYYEIILGLLIFYFMCETIFKKIIESYNSSNWKIGFLIFRGILTFCIFCLISAKILYNIIHQSFEPRSIQRSVTIVSSFFMVLWCFVTGLLWTAIADCYDFIDYRYSNEYLQF